MRKWNKAFLKLEALQEDDSDADDSLASLQLGVTPSQGWATSPTPVKELYGGAVTDVMESDSSDEDPYTCLLSQMNRASTAAGEVVSPLAQARPETRVTVNSEAAGDVGVESDWLGDFINTINVGSPTKTAIEVIDIQSPVVQMPPTSAQPVVPMPTTSTQPVVQMPTTSAQILRDFLTDERESYINLCNTIVNFKQTTKISTCTRTLKMFCVDYKGIHNLTVRDVQSLSYDHWINDVIVNGILQMIQKLNETSESANKTKYIANSQGYLTKEVPIYGRPFSLYVY